MVTTADTIAEDIRYKAKRRCWLNAYECELVLLMLAIGRYVFPILLLYIFRRSPHTIGLGKITLFVTGIFLL